jgi:hypothetical protein
MFLLIGTGVRRIGQRPPTSLAYYTGVTLQIWNGHLWRDSTKKLGEVTIYARWERQPTPAQIRWEKQRLAPVEGGWGDPASEEA